MAERRINWGADGTDAKYRTEDAGDPGNFVVAEDLDGNTILLEWNATSSSWEYGGPVDLDGNDLTDAGTTVYDASADTVGDGTTSADHASVTTVDLNIGTNDFVSSGDVVPVATFAKEDPNTTTSVTSTSFQVHTPDTDIQIQWGDYVPGDVTGVVSLSGFLEPGTDETLTVDMYNNTDSEEIVSISGDGEERSGWTTYTPNTTGSILRIFPRSKTEPANNTSDYKRLVFSIGWQL